MPVVDGVEDDEAAWAALEDAEKEVVRVLKEKLGPGQGHSRPQASRESRGQAHAGTKRDAAGQPAAAAAGQTGSLRALAPGTGARSRFAVGSKVEYWSKKQRKWLASTIIGVHGGASAASSTYDLDCKSRVPVWRLRGPRDSLNAPATPAAMPATPAAMPAALASASAADPEEAFKVGDQVRYWSTTAKQWIKAVVKEIHQGPENQVVSYTLNVKPQVSISKIRGPSTPANAPAPADEAQTTAVTSKKHPNGTSRKKAVSVGFEIGDKVEYWSRKSTGWLAAVVQTKREPGGRGPAVYGLRCKKLVVNGVTAARMRRPSDGVLKGSKGQAAMASRKRKAKQMGIDAAKVYAVGDTVDYWSKTNSKWLPGTVQAKKDPGSGAPIVYELRCHRLFVRGVLAGQLRSSGKMATKKSTGLPEAAGVQSTPAVAGTEGNSSKAGEQGGEGMAGESSTAVAGVHGAPAEAGANGGSIKAGEQDGGGMAVDASEYSKASVGGDTSKMIDVDEGQPRGEPNSQLAQESCSSVPGQPAQTPDLRPAEGLNPEAKGRRADEESMGLTQANDQPPQAEQAGATAA